MIDSLSQDSINAGVKWSWRSGYVISVHGDII